MTDIPVTATPPPDFRPEYPAPRRGVSKTAHFFLTVLGVVVGLFAFVFLLILLLSALGAAAVSGGGETATPSDTILSLDLRGGYLDQATGAPLFGSESPSTVRTVRALHAAAEDKSVEGLFVRGPASLAPSAAEEIADAIAVFEASGKFVVGFAQGFESTSVLSYMPMAGTELWLQGSTGFSVAGLQSEAEFFRGVFDLIDADVEFVQFEEYKTAADQYDETGFTEAGREATTALITSLYDTMVDRIADERDVDRTGVEAALRDAPMTAEDALAVKMVDRLGQLEDARQRARELTGDEDDATFLSVADYDYKRAGSGAPTIAFIGGQGAVVTGEGGGGNPLLGGSPVIASDTVAKAFDDAVEDEDVRAILFRVSSPGGSPAASDQIHAAVARAKEAGKPVVVSMGPYAASGGYYVAANADRILAMPSTITGSIGVLGGKIALEGAFAKVGYNIEQVAVGGEYVGVFSPDTPFTEYQEAGWTAQMANIYEDFTGVVAEGRDMPIGDVLEVAKGRVWTGEQAIERGLVDELGGVMAAVDAVKELAEIDEDTDVRLKRFPRVLTTEEQFLQLLNAQAQAQAQAGADLAELRALLDSPEVQAILRAREAAEPKVEIRARLPEIR